MYVVFFVLVAILAYGGLAWRNKPVLLLLSITATAFLMLMPMNDTVIISTELDQDWVGTEQGASTDMDVTSDDDIVLLKLEEGYEYTVWLWLHVALLIVHMVFFFGYIMRAM